jgi:hypothetical protein
MKGKKCMNTLKKTTLRLGLVLLAANSIYAAEKVKPGMPGAKGLKVFDEALEGPKKVLMIKEWKGFNAAQEAPQRMVIRDQKNWEKVWTAMTGNIMPQQAVPKMDFTKTEILAVFMGRKMTGGYAVRIVSIEEKDKLIVTVRESSPPPGGMVTMALTSPYHVVLIPKTGKDVKFVNQKGEK